MDPATIDYSRFTQNPELEGFRDELTVFIETGLKYRPIVLIRITTKKELADLAKATDSRQLFNFALCRNVFAGGFAFLVLVDHLKAMAAGKQPLESVTHFPQSYDGEDEDTSYAQSCATSFVKGDYIVVVAVSGVVAQSHGEEFTKSIGKFVLGRLPK